MATENERPSRDNDGEGRRSSDRNESGRPYNDRGEKKIFNRRDKGEGRDGGERRSYGNDRREDRGDRKPYGDRREGGERRSFGGDRDRKPYGDRREGGERRSFGGDRERKPYGDRREGGERRSFGGDRREESGERRSFGGDRNRNAGDGAEGGVKSFSLRRDNESRGNDDSRGERSESRRFDDNRGDRRPSRDDRGEGRPERKPYGDRSEGREGRSFGGDRERKPYNNDRREGGERRFDGERGERKSFGGDRKEGGERRSFDGNREDRGDRKPYGDRREGGERRSFGGDRDRKPYGDRREGGEGRSFGGDRREGGERRSFGGDRERKPYGDRREGGERRSFGGDRREEGGERKPYGDRREGGERKSFDRKDKFSKGGEERHSRSFDRSAESDHNPETPNYDLRRYKDNPRIKKTNRKGEDEDGSIRLNRYIANAGVCSRREADELILAGEIKVNGEAVTEMGFKVQPSDTVMYGKKVLSREKMVYVLLNKPKDFITTTEDPEGRKTVMSLVEKASKERIFPVGRLDRNTTGLLLFTNDGELAQKLTHPSNEIKKIYQVELDKPITKDDFQKVVEGVELEDGKAVVDDVAMLGDSKKFLGLEIHIGRNRIVRRIFEHLGYEVVTLDRVQYAGLTKKDLPRSEWRYLSEKEVIRLKYFM
jgi:23S rRNA pseudouridine2605 synthase